MKIAYIQKVFRPADLDIIETADAIASSMAEQDYTLTLRQLYYQFVHRNIFENVERNYDRLGRLVSDGRMAGLIDWAHIVDRTRRIDSVPHWDDPQAIMDDSAAAFRIDKWADQEYRPEAWVEKEALIDVIARPARRWDLTWFACRGYASQSSQHEAGMRFVEQINNGQTPIILHLGDHDPSGIDMSRDIYDRINGFVEYHTDRRIEVRRLALNMDQVRTYNPPPNPAKLSDSRSGSYVARFGESSWELDALDPPTIDALISAAVQSVLDVDDWDDKVATENEHRTQLKAASDRWDDVVELIGG